MHAPAAAHLHRLIASSDLFCISSLHIPVITPPFAQCAGAQDSRPHGKPWSRGRLGWCREGASHARRPWHFIRRSRDVGCYLDASAQCNSTRRQIMRTRGRVALGKCPPPPLLACLPCVCASAAADEVSHRAAGTCNATPHEPGIPPGCSYARAETTCLSLSANALCVVQRACSLHSCPDHDARLSLAFSLVALT